MFLKRIFASGACERSDQDCGPKSEFRDLHGRTLVAKEEVRGEGSTKISLRQKCLAKQASLVCYHTTAQ